MGKKQKKKKKESEEDKSASLYPLEPDVSDTLHDTEWVVGLIDARAPKPGPRGLYKKMKKTDQMPFNPIVILNLGRWSRWKRTTRLTQFDVRARN